MSDTFSVANFTELQHYRDRSPPWIKLYNKTLDNYELGQLPDASKAHLFAIWLLASRYNNQIPADAQWVAKRINATSPVDLLGLHKSGFIVLNQDCSILLAERKQSACLERERETEIDTLVSKETKDAKASKDLNGKPHPDPIKALFDAGIAILTTNGVAEKQARSVIGKWRGQIKDDGRLLSLLVQAGEYHKVDPIAYIAKAIETAIKPKATGMFA